MQSSKLADIAALIGESESLTYSNADESLRLALEATRQIVPGTDALLAVRALQRCATMQLIFGQMHEGQASLLKALTIAEKEDFDAIRGEIMQDMAAVYYTIGEYDDAIDYWSDCLDPANTEFTTETRVHSHIGLGQIYFAHENYEMALSHHQRAQRMAGTTLPAVLRCRVLINVATDCLRLEQLEDAEAALDEGLVLAISAGQKEYQEEICVYRATVAMDRGDLITAEQWLNRAETIEHVCLWGQNLRLLARGRLHVANGEYDAAHQVLFKALDLAGEMGISHKAYQAHHLLAQSYTHLGQLPEAEHHHKRYLEIFNRIVRPGTYSRLQQLEARIGND
ncbi:tetratricopeptide (TPR) repeat protein [Silvimonas terrae]|uniref:Tetratricopeptide (TPR) repeat protein n=1 Tax=Silvimonas terrae TaxID=300266 RepID=A0A840RH18_9NEIS|nr:tetratricopeptide repeat protein [Silvimonas terrae]MBB5191573.1 tetratricopeptide (TPR) repeat protein [Silvimonas terrae]